MTYDGSIRIGTKVDNDGVERGVKQIQSEFNKNAQYIEKTSQKIEEYKQKLQSLDGSMDGVIQEAREYYSAISEIDKVQSDKLTDERIAKSPEMSKLQSQWNDINSKINEYEKNLDDAKNKQIALNGELDNAKIKQQSLSVNTDGISKGISKGINSILKYALALLSIRSIYGLLSNAMNSWLNSGAEGASRMKADIEYMKFTLGNALAPLLKFIIEQLYRAFAIFGALLKAFFGIDIFANSLSNYMKSAAGSASKATKEVKELKRQLAGFDEINRLEEMVENASSGGGGGANISAPSFDLSNEMQKYNELAEKIKKVWDDMKAYVEPIIAGLIAGAIAKWLGADIKTSIGLALVVAGIKFISDGFEGLKNGEITGENLLKSLGGVLGLAVGSGILTGSVPLALLFAITGVGMTAQAIGEGELLYPLKALLGLDDMNTARGRALKNMNLDVAIKQISFSWFAIKEIAKLFELEEELKGAMLNAIVSALRWVAKQLEKIPFIGDSLALGINGGIKAMEGLVSNQIKDTMNNATTGSVESFRKNGEQLSGAYGTSFKDNIAKSQENFKETLEKTITEASNGASSKVGQQGNITADTFNSKLKDSVFKDKDNLKNTITNTTAGAVEDSKNKVKNTSTEMGKEIASSIGIGQNANAYKVGEASKGLADTANSKFSSGNFTSSGSNIVSGITKGINDNKWSLSSTMSSLGSLASATFKGILGIHSPSKVMADLAKFIPLGISEGIDSNSKAVYSSIGLLATGIEKGLEDMDIDYSAITDIPKFVKGSIGYIPKQSLSANIVQGVTTQQSSDNSLLQEIINKLSGTEDGPIYLTVDGEIMQRIQRRREGKSNFSVNGGVA